MEYVIVAVVVLFGAGLTFFSGFGLGTLMLPVFSLFFDLPVAIGATAVVHFANNIFKFVMVYKHIHYRTFLLFGIPALVAAIGGSALLTYFDHFDTITDYAIGGNTFEITTVGVAIGALMIFFAWFDLDPRFNDLKIKPNQIPFGGVLSGFFGGLSGHQGAFRSTFLTKAGLSKEQFIGTSNAVSLVVDFIRMSVYLFGASLLTSGESSFTDKLLEAQDLLIVGVIFAFVGTYFGKKLVKKTTIKGIQRVVGVMLFAIGGLMIAGII